MKIALLDVDGHNFPNLALMKLSAYYRRNGDSVEWFEPLFSHPDRLYASKVFTFTPDFRYFPSDCDIVRGGTGYDVQSKLPQDIEDMLPDYSIYPQYEYAIGFLTRGCVNKCPWCVVPRKEGGIRVVDSITRIAACNRRKIKLLDNNFLAADEEFVVEQLEYMIRGKWRIDFNQALDCRRVNERNAALLAKVRWDRYIRFACDTDTQFEPLRNAVQLLRSKDYHGDIMCYVLSKDIENALQRINKIAKLDVTPFCMPWRDLDNPEYKIPAELKKLARWCNIQSIRKSTSFNQYRTGKK